VGRRWGGTTAHVEIDGVPQRFKSVFEAEEAGIALIPQELEPRRP
jgi:ABC-type sugar transport system ATPase subunit